MCYFYSGPEGSDDGGRRTILRLSTGFWVTVVREEMVVINRPVRNRLSGGMGNFFLVVTK